MLKTTIPGFKNPEASVRRRFSDFLGLHSRMVAKYAGKGIVIPPAPEKSTVGWFLDDLDAVFICFK